MRNEGLGSEFCVNESQAHTVEMNRCQDVLYCHLNRSQGVNEGQEGFPPTMDITKWLMRCVIPASF